MATAEDCAVACLNHKPGVIQGPYVNLPCNAFAWCPDEICFEPDAHTHHKGDCWLKFTEGPAYPEVHRPGMPRRMLALRGGVYRVSTISRRMLALRGGVYRVSTISRRMLALRGGVYRV